MYQVNFCDASHRCERSRDLGDAEVTITGIRYMGCAAKQQDNITRVTGYTLRIPIKLKVSV